MKFLTILFLFFCVVFTSSFTQSDQSQYPQDMTKIYPIEGLTKEHSVATRNAPNNQGLSSGADRNVTYRIRHVATDNIRFPRLIYSNWYLNKGETNGPNSITVKGAIEFQDIIYPINFIGKEISTIIPGGMTWSDPIDITIPKGSIFYTRTNVSVAKAGQKWPVSLTTYPENGEGKSDGDVAYSGPTQTSFEFAYSPSAIIGEPSSDMNKSIIIIGDSIAAGQGDKPNDSGFIIRAFHNQFSYLQVSKQGAQTSDFLANVRTNRMILSNYATDVLFEIGINDVRSGTKLEKIKKNVLDIAKEFSNRGIPFYATTLTPLTTSTDHWDSTQNQKITNHEQVRVAYNEWIRSRPMYISGYFDIADSVETSRNSGIWKPRHTNDGIHPNSSGHAEMATAISPNLFK